MKRRLPLEAKGLTYLLCLFVVLMTFTSVTYAGNIEVTPEREDLTCGSIHAFEFANGSDWTSIENNGTYTIDELPEHFYVDAIASNVGSVKFKVKNLDTGHERTVIENYAPYTFPAGGAAWDLGTGNFRVTARAYWEQNAQGTLCDTDIIEFTLTEIPDNCGHIENFEFRGNNGEIVHINDNDTFDIASLPEGFFIELNGTDGSHFESVGFTVKNLDTGVMTNITENNVPWNFPNSGTPWNLGVGTFQIDARIYSEDNKGGVLCDSEWITFTLTDNCGELDFLKFTDGAGNTLAIEDGGTYNVNDLPDNVYINAMTIGHVGSFRFYVKNLTTDVGQGKLENVIPYDFNVGFDFGPGEYRVDTTIYSESGGHGAICDEDWIFFTIIETCDADAGTVSTDAMMVCFEDAGTTLTAGANGDAVVPDGYENIYLLTSGTELVIEDSSDAPSFTVSEEGKYTIHSLVYDPDTLDLGIIDLGTTTAGDVLPLLVQGGGDICASLDVDGAMVVAENPQAGTSTPDEMEVALENGSATISATPNDDMNIPDGYSSVFVLSQGEDLVLIDSSDAPSFTVTETGKYTIHKLVYNPDTLDLSIIDFGTTTGADVFGLLVAGGGDICASLDVTGAMVMVVDPPCDADAGTMSTDAMMVCFDDGSATVSATANGDAVVPDGYENIYLLTSGTELVIEDSSDAPSFTVSEEGKYTVHSLVYDPDTLDLGIIDLGTTTAGDVLPLLVQGGGDICASLDVDGAMVVAENPQAGTITPDEVEVIFENGSATISATPDGNSNVPEGYETIYILVQGFDQVIVDSSQEPTFNVLHVANYKIFTLVYNPDTFDLSLISNNSLISEVAPLLVENGGDICASLDTVGAMIMVIDPPCDADAGTMSTDDMTVCFDDGSATVSATASGDAMVPDGYENIYLLTSGTNLVIEDFSNTPSFTVNEEGKYTVHSLVYDPDTANLNTINLGTTKIANILPFIIQGGGDICASLDVDGAMVIVENPQAGTITPDEVEVIFENGSATISATPDGNSNVPEGYETIYILVQGFDQVIVGSSQDPTFNVLHVASYKIFTLVYNPDTFDLSLISNNNVISEVAPLLVENGGDICASLDSVGAMIMVVDPPCDVDAGTMTPTSPLECIGNGDASTLISATGNNDCVIPEGFTSIYLLTFGNGLTILEANTDPSFDVTIAGDFGIHKFVYNPDEFNPLAGVEFGVTTVFDCVNLVNNLGLCADIDVDGARIWVDKPLAGTLTAVQSEIEFTGTPVQVEATPNGDISIPSGYAAYYFLAEGTEQVVTQAGNTPSFSVSETGSYSIHTLVYDPEFLMDITTIYTLGTSTINDVAQPFLSEEYCGDFDSVGAQIDVVGPSCGADAGTLTAENDMVSLDDGSVLVTAIPDGNAVVPDGFSVLYLLSTDQELVIQATGDFPSFTVFENGLYTVHVLVYDAGTFDLSVVQLGVTTAFEVEALLIEGGGDICASLDVPGAPVDVADPNPDSFCDSSGSQLMSPEPIVCFDDRGLGTLSVEVSSQAVIPNGFQEVYLLSNAFSGRVYEMSDTPTFEVGSPGYYIVRSMVYDPTNFDMNSIVMGQSTVPNIAAQFAENGGTLCGSIDMQGLVTLVLADSLCEAYFDTRASQAATLTGVSQDNLRDQLTRFSSNEEAEMHMMNTLFPVSMYPNPVREELSVNAAPIEREVMDVTIYDLSGRIMYSGQMEAFAPGDHKINVGKLTNGVYMARLKSTHREIIKRIIVSK